MSDAIKGSFSLESGENKPGAPHFQCSGDFEPEGRIKANSAKITQSVPPPNGNIPVKVSNATWGLEVFNNQQTLRMTLPCEAEPADGKAEKFDATFQFPVKPPLQPGQTVSGTGSFGYGNNKVKDVPAKLTLG